jgi:hypothetical protein
MIVREQLTLGKLEFQKNPVILENKYNCVRMKILAIRSAGRFGVTLFSETDEGQLPLYLGNDQGRPRVQYNKWNHCCKVLTARSAGRAWDVLVLRK